MAIAYFTIPETGKIIYNGDTVILSEYPDTIAAVAYGWYKYEENAMNGWHFILLPSKSIIPAANVNLSLLTVVPNSSDDDRNPIPLNTSLQDIESRAFITLDSIAQRDKLIPEFMPNGRIVRVNDSVNHTTNYYEWNIETQSWDDWNIESEIDTKVDSAINGLAAPIIFSGEITSWDSETEKATVRLSDSYKKRENIPSEVEYAEYTSMNNINGIVSCNVAGPITIVPGHTLYGGDLSFVDGLGYWHVLPRLFGSSRVDYDYISNDYNKLPTSKVVYDALDRKLDAPDGFSYTRTFKSYSEYPPKSENVYGGGTPTYTIGDRWIRYREESSTLYVLLDAQRRYNMGNEYMQYYWFDITGSYYGD